jgi:serine/threonine protein kinase
MDLSDDYKDFVMKILQKNPKNRLRCEDLLRHPFIEQYRELETCEELC